MSIRCIKFTAIEKGALKGFADLALDSGMTLHDCAVMESNGRRWVGLPGKPMLNPDRTVKIDAATGKVAYAAVVTITDKDRRDLFSNSALAAIDFFRAEQQPPQPAAAPPQQAKRPGVSAESAAVKAAHAVHRPFDDPLPFRAQSMKAKDLRRHADAMREAIGETLQRVRNSTGRCCCCGVAEGVHAQACAVWPIIAARAAYAADAEPNLFNEAQA